MPLHRHLGQRLIARQQDIQQVVLKADIAGQAIQHSVTG